MIILPDDLDREVNKKIDKIIFGLVEEGEKIMDDFLRRNRDGIYEILENIQIWYKIRRDCCTIDRNLNNRYFNLFRKFIGEERL